MTHPWQLTSQQWENSHWKTRGKSLPLDQATPDLSGYPVDQVNRDQNQNQDGGDLFPVMATNALGQLIANAAGTHNDEDRCAAHVGFEDIKRRRNEHRQHLRKNAEAGALKGIATAGGYPLSWLAIAPFHRFRE